jgi:hypothetical protein
MSAQVATVVDDSVSFDVALKADETQQRARRWTSDLFAAFSAARAYVWTNHGEQLLAVYGKDDAPKILAEAFNSYAALIDAAAKDETGSKVRRFHLAAWNAQLFKERGSLSKRLGEEEYAREKSRLDRAWHRTGWKPVHQLQRVTHLPFFDREAREFKANQERKAATFIDHLTDLLIETMRAVRASGKRSPWRFNKEFTSAVEQWRASEGFKPFAPDWEPGPGDGATSTGGDSDTGEDEPTVRIEKIIRRAAQRAGKVAMDRHFDECEIDAAGLALVEWLGEEWQRQTGRALSVPPVSQGADSTIREAPRREVGSAENGGRNLSFSAGKFNFTADNLSPLNSVREVLEMEPEDEPRGVSLADAEAAVTAVASVVNGRVKVVYVDDTKPEGANVTKTHDLSLAEFQDQLPALLEYNSRTRESMTTRLHFKGDTRLIQLDDCPPDLMSRLAPLSFLQASTSPGNGQTWLALPEGLALEQYEGLRRRLLTKLKPTGANGGAYGSIRFPGSLNCKPKRRYADGEPCRVQLLRGALGRVVTEAELDAANLLAPAPPKPTPAEVRAVKSRIPVEGFPDMAAELYAAGGDRSRAEFVWCLKALRRGFSEGAVEVELSSIGEKARVRQRDGYIRETVRKAAREIGLDSPLRLVNNATTRAPSQQREVFDV